MSIRNSTEQVNFPKVPLLMRDLRQWVVWKRVKQNDKVKKLPYNPRTRRPARSNDPSTWSTLEEAIKTSDKGHYAGIGFMFASGFVGIDLDDCRDRDTGEIEDWAIDIVNQLQSYTEVSPSGNGLHIFIKGKLPGSGLNKRNWNGRKIEIYDSGRYFTFTGDHLEETPLEINHRQAEIESLYNQVNQDTAGSVKTKHKAKSPPLSDHEIMDLAMNAKNGPKFEKLWDGDSTEYSSVSEADLAFVRILTFYTQDVEQIELLWKSSPRYRTKLERGDYIVRTIETALSTQTKFFRPSSNLKHSGGVKGHFEVTDSEIEDEGADPPISKDYKREDHLRRVLAYSSKMTRARMMMVSALGFKKVSWRLLNAIHAYQRNRLGVKVITDKMLKKLYQTGGEPSASERTIRRDKEKLWNAQKEVGVELVWYWHGRQNLKAQKNYGSKYISNLDRWALMAIDQAMTANYQIRDEQLKAACGEIAARIIRQPKTVKNNKRGEDMVSEILTLEKQVYKAGNQYRKLVRELQNKMADAGYTGGEICQKLQDIKEELKVPLKEAP